MEADASSVQLTGNKTEFTSRVACLCVKHVGTRGAVVAAPAPAPLSLLPLVTGLPLGGMWLVKFIGEGYELILLSALSSRAEDQHSRLLTHTDDARLPPPSSWLQVQGG